VFFDNGANSVENMGGREMVGRGDFGLSSGFKGSLGRHECSTTCPQPGACNTVYNIIDTWMIWCKTSKHVFIGSIDNGINLEGANITLPEDDFSLVEDAFLANIRK